MNLFTRLKKSLDYRIISWPIRRTENGGRRRVNSSFSRHLDVKSFTAYDELALLEKYAGLLRDGDTIVELGSYLGASTRYLIYGSRNISVNIWCIDTWMNETMPDGNLDTFQEFKQNIAPFDTRVRLVRANSLQLAVSDLPNEIDLAFIDGDHSFEGVKNDINLVIPNLRRGAIVAFHDVKDFGGVARCVGSLLETGDWTILDFVRNLIVLQNLAAPK
jgi:predicted O-methyltransferase YrrM